MSRDSFRISGALFILLFICSISQGANDKAVEDESAKEWAFTNQPLTSLLYEYQSASECVLLISPSIDGTELVSMSGTGSVQRLADDLAALFQAHGVQILGLESGLKAALPADDAGMAQAIRDLAAKTAVVVARTNAEDVLGISMRFGGAPLDQVLDLCQDITGKTFMRPPHLGDVEFSFHPEKRFTPDEAIRNLQLGLRLHGLGFKEFDKDTVGVVRLDNPLIHSKKQISVIKSKESKFTGEEIRKHLQEYNLEVIRKGLPPLPIPLTPEQDKKLVEEDLLPPNPEN